MVKINQYVFSVFSFILKVQQNGLLEKANEYKLHKNDKKLLEVLYNTYEIYKLKITFNQFIGLVKQYSLDTNQDIIKSGDECAIELKKLIK